MSDLTYADPSTLLRDPWAKAFVFLDADGRCNFRPENCFRNSCIGFLVFLAKAFASLDADGLGNFRPKNCSRNSCIGFLVFFGRKHLLPREQAR